MKKATTICMLALSLALTAPAFGGQSNGKGGTAPTASNEHSVLSLAEAEDLRFLREEEKLARDVYLTLYKQWNIPVFENIAASEQNHMDAVKDLLDKYRVEDPAMPQVGQFQNPDLQAAYDQLVQQGAESQLQALRVGGYIEELDIGDLADMMARTQREDILTVLDDLMRGSRNHLRAFAGTIEDLGIPYEAQILTQEEVDAIIDSPMERGR